MKKSTKIKKSLLCCLICCTVLGACKETVIPQTDTTYKTLTVALSDKTLQSYYSATISGRQDVEIRPQVSGLITQVCIQEGANVKKGQTLFIIDQVPYKAALQTAIANVESAEANVATARLTAESKEELFRQQVVSDFDLQTAQNTLRSQEAALAQAQAEEINARNNLSYTEVKSPSDGVAGMIPYRIGALVGPSIATPLVTISDDEEMYVYFSMTENQVLALSRQNGSLKNIMQSMPEVQLQLSDGSLYPLQGKVDAISGIISSSTGAISLRAVFPNPDRVLRSGGSGNIVFPYEKKNCIVIPQEATYEIQDKIYVYEVVDGKTKSTPITVFGMNNGLEYVVESGLQTGDIIIAEGAGLLKNGMEVKINNNKTDSNDKGTADVN